MANSLKSVAAYQVTNAFTTAYTVPSSTTFTVSMVHFCNTTASAVTVRACLVPNAGSPTSANALMYDFSIAANDVIELLKGDMWPAQSTFQVLASSNSAVVLKLAGIETT